MKSFRLHTGSAAEIVQFIVAAIISIGLFWTLRYFHITDTGYRVISILVVAVFVAYLCRGTFCRSLRRQYPNARWIGLLAVGFSIATFGTAARFIVPGADQGSLTLGYIVMAGACIATFVIISERPGCDSIGRGCSSAAANLARRLTHWTSMLASREPTGDYVSGDECSSGDSSSNGATKLSSERPERL
ncbi:MAG: hypothetical protein U0941_02635 [Planctomycetaceae bacterium]